MNLFYMNLFPGINLLQKGFYPIIAIDPGPDRSGVAIGALQSKELKVLDHAHVDNEQFVSYLRAASWIFQSSKLIIEAPTGNAQKLSIPVRDTIFWYGRFFETWMHDHAIEDQSLITYTPSALRAGLLGDNKYPTSKLLQYIRDRWGVKKGVTPAGKKATDHELIAVGLIYLFMKRRQGLYV